MDIFYCAHTLEEMHHEDQKGGDRRLCLKGGRNHNGSQFKGRYFQGR